MKNSLKTYFQIALFTGISAGIISCSNTKFLKEGQFLYTGAKIKIEDSTIPKKDKRELKDGLEENLTPKPNSSFLGLRPKLYIYNITKEPKKQKGFLYWLKYKVGEKPVLLSDVDREFNKEIIVNYSENKGYFNAKASYDTLTKNKKAEVHYTVKPKKRYYFGEIHFPSDSSVLSSEIQQLSGKTFLKTGEPFDLDVIKAERQRIDNGLKERGFYYFDDNDLVLQVDSTVSENQRVEAFLKLKDNTPQLAKEQFTIDKTIVFPDYSIQGEKEGLYHVPMSEDSLQPHLYNDIYVVDPMKKFKPKIFDRALYFEKGDLYNRSDHNLTLNRLISLGVFKFVKNEFVLDTINKKFDAYYLLTPQKLQSLRLELLGKTNSANYAGSELNLNWTHRNFFRGAEQLKLSAFGGFDVQVGGAKPETKGSGNIFRFGGDAQLSIPRILAPFRFKTSSAYVPRTNISLGYEFMSRIKWYTLNTFNTSFGYNWKENARKEHELKVLDVSYVRPSKITPEYDSIQNAFPYLKHVTEEQLIFGPTYTYTYTTTMLPKKNTVYYRGLLDLAGNLTGLLSGANAKKGEQKEIFGVPFSQYVKMENDFRFYHKISEKTQFASRLIAGLAYPYGNSLTIPYSRQFFAGGSNSIRSFRARTLGPGSYDPRTATNSYVFDQAGDIKLELNAEYRTNLYKFLNAAVFVDAGNIWLVNEDTDRPGAKFSKDWLSEVAIGGGIGLRMDFSILILRLDLAMPFRVPYYDKNDRWMFDKIDFGNKDWRRNNLVLNIAIGYPF